MRHRSKGLKRRYGHATVKRAHWYNVRLNGKLIEEVSYTAVGRNKTEREDEVRRSLVGHDRFDSRITVTEVKRGR